MGEKYIELLFHQCIDKKNSKILFIHYNIEIDAFVKKVEKYAKKVGLEEVYLEGIDPNVTHDLLKNKTLEEIEESKYFDRSIWDDYASRKACFLIFETEYPHLMEDIEDEKITYASKLSRESKPLYRKMVERCELSWCIAAYPGQEWAKEIFKDAKDSYQKLENAIYKICMVDQRDPVSSWELFLKKQQKIIEKLNSLSLKKLHYLNSLGTDLTVSLPDGYLFSSAKDREVIVNMPSYEVFASPVFDKTEGIVYSSMPLNYNGKIVDNFWIRFQNGKAVDYDAKIGKEILKGIIESDKNSCFLGECALVEYDSPISNLGLVFGTTLIDENASCHLALGAGFAECLEGGLKLEEDTLSEKGINVSRNHVDFMIGTSDLKIVGITKNGKEISIFKDGNFDEVFLSCL